ncbi:MAG: PH domain-containing protein [Spirochaetota bacterium]
MKEFVLSPPPAILYFSAAVLAVVVLSVLLKQGQPVKKAIGLGIAVVVLGLVLLVFYRPTTIAVDSEGISIRGPGGTELGWSEVDSAVYEPNLATSPFRPTVRTRGIAIGEYRAGMFLLSNGNRARVSMEQSEAAVVLRTSDLTYVLAPDDAAGLAGAIDEYRTYDEGDPQ